MKKKNVKKPWGGFEQFTLNEISTVKILTIKPRQRFSLQKHKGRKELWRFLDNPAKVTMGSKTVKVRRGQEIMISKGMRHRIEAYSKPVNVLEIAFGKFDEKDIVRIEDDYGRVEK